MISETMVIEASSGGVGAIDFAALVEAEQGRLQRMACRLLRDPDDARDLVQTALAEAYERRRSLRDPDTAGAWLRRILVSRALNHLRRRRLWRRFRETFWAADDREQAAPGPAPDAMLASSRRLAAVSRSVEALPARQAAAFTLRYVEGLDLDGIAAAMGVGRGTVRTHLRRALSSLRGSLVEPEDSP